jgi:hypothetical protein
MLPQSVKPMKCGKMWRRPRNADKENKDVFKSDEEEWLHVEAVPSSKAISSQIATVAMTPKLRPKFR